MTTWLRLYADRAATTQRVSALFEQLVAQLPLPDVRDADGYLAWQ